MGISLWAAEISVPNDIEPVFAKIAQERADGVVRAIGSMLFVHRARMGTAAIAQRLPLLTFAGEEVPYGPLMSYGQDFPIFSAAQRPIPTKYLKAQNLPIFPSSNQQSSSWF
jgi:hypothetical protein